MPHDRKQRVLLSVIIALLLLSSVAHHSLATEPASIVLPNHQILGKDLGQSKLLEHPGHAESLEYPKSVHIDLEGSVAYGIKATYSESVAFQDLLAAVNLTQKKWTRDPDGEMAQWGVTVWRNEKNRFAIQVSDAQVIMIWLDRRITESEREATLSALLNAALVNGGALRAPTIDELKNLPVGMEVTHQPNPAYATLTEQGKRRGKFTWWYKTQVKATGSGVRIEQFGSFLWLKGQWRFANFTQKPFSSKEFSDWYSCPDGYLKPGKVFVDPKNWGSADQLKAGKALWYFIGVDEEGRRVKGEAIVDVLGEMAPQPRAAKADE